MPDESGEQLVRLLLRAAYLVSTQPGYLAATLEGQLRRRTRIELIAAADRIERAGGG